MNKILIDKTILHQEIIKKLELVYASALAATQTATDKENVPEHKYDTLSLEASYLAHGQAQRLQQCLRDLHSFKDLAVKNCLDSDSVNIGALVKLLDDDEDSYKWFFLSPVAGGLSVQFSNIIVQLITPESPLGKTLMRRAVDDEIVIKIATHTKCYEIMSIY
ncbi:transcription elongation factor [Vibrio sp. S17_S38]|nr:transcription elongation factor [Vibrio sp. S17_S38]